MISARIYKPARTAMQSGSAKTKQWILEYDAKPNKKPEPLMGWTQSEDTLQQVKLKFDSMEEAQRYAEDKGIYAVVQPQTTRKVKPRNYGDNFRYFPPGRSQLTPNKLLAVTFPVRHFKGVRSRSSTG